jgi:hypothetical protein
MAERGGIGCATFEIAQIFLPIMIGFCVVLVHLCWHYLALHARLAPLVIQDGSSAEITIVILAVWLRQIGLICGTVRLRWLSRQ